MREIQGIPYDRCSERTATQVTWSPEYVTPMLDRVAEEGLSVVKVHSHPSSGAAFSATDNEGDARLLLMIRGWVEADIAHGSAVMLPDGVMFGRVLRSGKASEPIDCIAVAGDNLDFWYADSGGAGSPRFVASDAQMFGESTIERMRRLSVAFVGASETGSLVIEQLQRLCVGELLIVDDARMEKRNVICVLNSTMKGLRLPFLAVERAHPLV